jgi:predicted enzyme related to lactoylglutathione lyase
MQVNSIDMCWIVVKDLSKALKYYTEVVGLKLMEHNEEYHWAELEGHAGKGTRLGIAQDSDMEDVKPGQNAVVTFTVKDIEKALDHMKKKGANLVGKLIEIPHHVKMQTVKDNDGNSFQMVQVLAHSCAHC